MDATMPAGARPEPRQSRTLVPSAVMAMLLFIFTEAMLFAGLISAHAIVKAGAQAWPPLNQPRLPFAETLINSAALLASGAILVVARFAFRTQPSRAVAPLGLAVLLGTFFVGFQGREWMSLIGEGLTLTSSPYGSFFYVIVGAHAVHALAALAAMGWAWVRLRQDRLTAVQLSAVEVFWYFVVLVWPVIYLKVYL